MKVQMVKWMFVMAAGMVGISQSGMATGKDDFIVCKRTVRDQTYYYVYQDHQWTISKKWAFDIGDTVKDCDEMFKKPDAKEEEQPNEGQEQGEVQEHGEQ